MRCYRAIWLTLVFAFAMFGQTIGWVRVGGFYPDTSLSEAFDDKYLIDDINGDNYPEIAISGHRGSIKFVRFYWGGPGSIDTLPDFEITYPYSGTGFEDFRAPYAVPELGDVNGDDFGDLGIRMPDYTDEWSTFYCGKVFLYWGGPSLDTICDWSYSDPSGFYQNLGTDLVGVGDWNADGYDDFAVSAPSGWEAYGRIYFFLGGNPPSSTPAKIWEGDTVQAGFGTELCSGQFSSDTHLDLLSSSYYQLDEMDTVAIYKIHYLAGSDTFDISQFEVIIYDTFLTGECGDALLHPIGDLDGNSFIDLWIKTPSFIDYTQFLLGGEDSLSQITIDSVYWIDKKFNGIGDVTSDGIDDFYTYYGSSHSHYGEFEVFAGDSLFEYFPLYYNDSVQGYHSNAKDLNNDNYPEILCHVEGWNLYTLNRDYAVNVPDVTERPITFKISVSPNPFNEAVSFQVYSALETNSYLKIYDIRGREVYTRKIELHRGNNNFLWKGTDNKGFQLPSGCYLLTINTNKRLLSYKLIMLK